MPSTFEDIQQLCRDFRRKLRSGQVVRIEDYLTRVDENSRGMLFQNLLHIDIEYQRRQGDEPSSDAYIRRFPDHAGLVRQAFFESTLMTVNPDVETPADEDTVMFGALPARRLGDYELLRELGRGGFGVVYEARHLKRGDVVALKTLPLPQNERNAPQDDAERLHRFRREFRSLCDINHPNLVGMQSLEVDGRQWFFTMDVVDGGDFLQYVRPDGRLNEDRLRAVLQQLVTGIVALHRRGIVHRDLKPGNVFVGSDGHVTIMDFGLVAELQRQTNQTMSMMSQQFAGTPRYAAPEQTRGIRSAASDWYAIGVMLYEAVTGKPPFAGSHVEVVVNKQTQDAPLLTGRKDVPEDLAELVDQLLRRDPDDRPEDSVLERTFGLVEDSVSYDSVDSHGSSLTADASTVLIGRETQLAQLKQAQARLVQTRDPSAVFIRGRSGEGKTALANRFLDTVRLSDEMVVLSGRCYDRESVPFKAIDCLIDALVSYLRSRPQDEVRALLPDDIPLLTRLFPVLRRVEPITALSAGRVSRVDSRQVRNRAFAALRELLTSIGHSTPVILFVDDLQWGDADSASAVAEIVAPPEAPAVMLLGSFRSDEAEDSPFLNEWNSGEIVIRQSTIDVSALTRQQSAALLSARLGVAVEEISAHVDQVWQSAQGNPYFLEQLLEGFDPRTGTFTEVPLRDLIGQRLARLPAEASALLDTVAVAGQAVSLTEVGALTCGMERAYGTVSHMRNERLVRLIGSDDEQLVDTWHDKVRETVLAAMPDDERLRLHIQFGERLQQQAELSPEAVLEFLEQDPLLAQSGPPDSDRVFDLAFHFHAAEDPRAFAYLFLAGELSFRAYASEDALESLSQVLGCCAPDVSQPLRFRLHERLGRTHQRLRHFDLAVSDFNRALEYAGSSLQRAHVYSCIGEVHVGRTEYREALENFDCALSALRLPRPTGLSALLRTGPELLRVLLRLPKWNDQPQELSDQRARYDIYLRVLNSLLVFIWEVPSGMASYPFIILRMQTTAHFVNGTDAWGRSVAHSAGQISLNGLPWLARRLLDRARVAEDSIGDLETQGLFLSGSAMANQYSGDRQLADKQYLQGYQNLLKSGTHFYCAPVAHMHRHLHSVIAPSSVELESARRTLWAAESIGDSRSQCWGHYDIASALARAGEIDEALHEIERARQHLKSGERFLTDAIFLATEGYVRLQASSYAGARFSLESAWFLARKRKLLMDVVIRCLPWLMESLLGPRWTQPLSGPMARRLRRLCLVAAVVDRVYPNIASPAERARGRVFAALGSRRKAIRCFRTAITRAEACSGTYDRARSLLDLSAIDEPQCDALRTEAATLLQQQESVVPWAERWLLADRHIDTCVAPPGRTIGFRQANY